MKRWRAGAAMAFIAAIAAVVSYNDGLQVARLAGAFGWVAYLYPLLPDGLIVICLIALYEGARMKEPQRPGWASAGLVLGAGLTLAQNVGAGAATGVLLAVIDGFVPVVFFVAAEVLIWTIRHSRPVPATEEGGGEVPSSNVHAARMRLKVAARHGFKVTPNDTQERFGLTRAAARGLHAEFAPKEAPAGTAPIPAGALNGNGPHG